MDNFFNELGNISHNVLSGIQNVGSTIGQDVGNIGQSVSNFFHPQAQPQQPNPQIQQQFNQSFQNFLGSAEHQGQLAIQGVQNTAANIPDFVGNAVQGANTLIGNILKPNIGINGFPSSPVNNFVAQTPAWLQNNIASPLENAIPGQNILSNAGRDIVGAGVGLAGLPGVAAQFAQNPVPTATSLVGNMVNQYKGDLGFDQQGNWNLQNVGNNFYQHPVRTLLDVLPAAGLLGKAGIVAKAGEVADLPEATAAEGLPEGIQQATTGTPQARLANLLNYPAEMRNSGFSPSQIDQTSAPLWQDLKANNVTPNNFDNFLKSDQHSQVTADTTDAMANPNSLSLLKGQPQQIQNAFADWVNSRSAAPIQGIQQAKNFSQYDSLGQQGMLDFEKNPSQFADLKQYFDNKFDQLQAQGVDMGKVQNYIPHFFKDVPQATDFANRTLSQNIPFSFERLVQSYQQGIDSGLTPKYNTLGQLAQAYEATTQKFSADNSFFNYLRQNNLIQPAGKAPQGWQDLGQGFPKKTTTLDDGSTYTGTYQAPPNLANAINNYLKPNRGILNNVANVQSRIKNTILSSGIPGTGINYHGGTVLWRQILSGENPVSSAWTGIKYLANPQLAQKAIDSNLGGAVQAVKSGLNLSIEDHNFLQDQASNDGVLGKLSGLQQKFFENPLFQQALPALKLERYQDISNYLIKNGMDEQTANKTAALQTNNIFGGQNLNQIARSSEFQNLARNLVLAPDFVESTIGTGKGMAEALLDPTNPVGHTYRLMARNTLMAYITEQATNLALNGKLTVQQAGHPFDIGAGTNENGQQRYVNPWFSSIDFAKVPFDIASGLMGGNSAAATNTVRNRLAPGLAMTLDQIANQNFSGQPLYKQGANMGQQMLGRGEDIASSTMPPYLSAAARLATGNATPEQAGEQALMAPVKWSNYASTQVEQNLVDMLKSGGASGQEIAKTLAQYKANQNAKYAGNPYAQKPSVLSSVMSSLGIGAPKPSQGVTTSKTTGDLLLDTLNQKKSITDQAATVKQIFESGMTPQQIQQALAAKGIDPTQARLTMMKSLTDQEKAPILKQLIGASGNSWIDTVHSLAKAGVLTTGVTAYWQGDGTISSSYRTRLDKEIAAGKGTGTTTTSGSSTSTRSSGLPSIPGSIYRSRLLNGVSMPSFQYPAKIASVNFHPKTATLKPINYSGLSKVTNTALQNMNQIGNFKLPPASSFSQTMSPSLKYADLISKMGIGKSLPGAVDTTGSTRNPTGRINLSAGASVA